MRPSDGVAWVTGASSGIGYKLCETLAREGWSIAASARSAEKLAALTTANPSIKAYRVDVSDPDAVAQTVSQIESELGPIALAVFNAGVYLPVKAEAPDWSRFKTTFDVNVLGVAAGLAAVNPRMCERRKGQIAIVSSATGFGGMPTASAYGASKAALINMAECLNIELARWGVKVQVVTPGFVETPAQDENEFPKPFMVSAEHAAMRIVRGLKRGDFNITFPRRFTWGLKALYGLPANWRLPLIRRQTGWNEPLDT